MLPLCMGEHPRYIVGYEGSLEDLAEEIATDDVRVASFIGSLAQDIERQASDDMGRERYKLASGLEKTARALSAAERAMNCEPARIVIEGYAVDDLAQRAGNMSYDVLQTLVERIADGIEQRTTTRVEDNPRLYRTISRLRKAGAELGKVWDICEPYMP